MTNINPQDVKKLREMTGAGVMDAKRALTEAGGNFDGALKVIKEKGLAKVEKRAGRDARAGIIYSYVHNERIGVLLDVRAETDFVVRSEPFKKLAHELAMQIAATGPENEEALLAQPYIRDESKTVKDIINEVIVKTGEKVAVNGFSRMEI